MESSAVQGTSLPVPEILWNSCDGMMLIDEQRRILAVNPALEEMVGRRAQEMVGRAECAVLFSCRGLDNDPYAEQPWNCPGLKAIAGASPVRRAEYILRTAEGKEVVVEASYTPIQLPYHPAWAVAVLRDVSARMRRERRLLSQARQDPLTHLPNRTAFLETLRRELKRAERHRHPLAIALVDLDGFKQQNDRFGHLVGDKLLRSVALHLRKQRRASDFIARYGGDEFVLLLPETDAAGALVTAERIRSTMRYPFLRERRILSPDLDWVRVTLSAGVALYPSDGASPEDLLNQADRRLYHAKSAGGNRVVGPPISPAL